MLLALRGERHELKACATQSLTLQSYLDWRTLNLGRSAAIAYILLFLVTIIATAYVAWARGRIRAS